MRISDWSSDVCSSDLCAASGVFCMSHYDYDLFVIGAGSGGVRAARVSAAHGAKVAVAEEHRVGGTCVIRGCVPKKLLVYGAHFAEDLQDAKRFGWEVSDCRFNWPTLRDNVLAAVDRLNGLYTQPLETHGVEIIHERAVVTRTTAGQLASGRTVTARSRPVAVRAWPGGPGRGSKQIGITTKKT